MEGWHCLHDCSALILLHRLHHYYHLHLALQAWDRVFVFLVAPNVSLLPREQSSLPDERQAANANRNRRCSVRLGSQRNTSVNSECEQQQPRTTQPIDTE